MRGTSAWSPSSGTHVRTTRSPTPPGPSSSRHRLPAPRHHSRGPGATRNDDDKLGEASREPRQEDPVVPVGVQRRAPPDDRAQGLGELHLDIQIERLARKYGVKVETERPRIAYRETITRKAEAHGRHKKQSGGRGQFGRLLGSAGAPSIRLRLPVRGRDQGRRHSEQVHSFGGQGDPRRRPREGSWPATRSWTSRGVLRRQLPRGRLFGYRFPDRRVDGVPDGGSDAASRAPRAHHRDRGHDPRVVHGRCDGRYQPAAREGARHGRTGRADDRSRPGARGGAL